MQGARPKRVVMAHSFRRQQQQQERREQKIRANPSSSGEDDYFDVETTDLKMTPMAIEKF
jgi:hypothetical protein